MDTGASELIGAQQRQMHAEIYCDNEHRTINCGSSIRLPWCAAITPDGRFVTHREWVTPTSGQINVARIEQHSCPGRDYSGRT